VKRALLIALAAAAIFAAQGLSDSGASGAARPTLYVSPTGSDGGGCTRAAPCRAFDAAFKVATPGARDHGGAPVVFAPAPGAKVVIADELNVFASHAEFADMTVSDWYVRAGATDLTFRRMKVQLFFIRSASRIRVLGGSVGGIDSADAATIGATYQSTVPSRDILLDGVSFHDITRQANPAGHVQCLFVQSVDGLVIRNSTFRHCDVFDVYVNNIGVGPVPQNMLFENDLFDRASDGGFYSLYVRNDPGDTIGGLVVRYSSFLQGPHFDSGAYTHSRVVGNVSPYTAARVRPQRLRRSPLWPHRPPRVPRLRRPRRVPARAEARRRGDRCRGPAGLTAARHPRPPPAAGQSARRGRLRERLTKP